MSALSIINKYYPEESEGKKILIDHSISVTQKALKIADAHPELNLDIKFLEYGAMLHDIGIFLTDAPSIYCFGIHPYICHGYLGANILRSEGYEKLALVCERHTGAGISMEHIIKNNLPLPHREMIPVSMEEQVICFADKFFSKTKLDKEKSVDKALKSISRFGEEGTARFIKWCDLFL